MRKGILIILLVLILTFSGCTNNDGYQDLSGEYAIHIKSESGAVDLIKGSDYTFVQYFIDSDESLFIRYRNDTNSKWEYKIFKNYYRADIYIYSINRIL